MSPPNSQTGQGQPSTGGATLLLVFSPFRIQTLLAVALLAFAALQVSCGAKGTNPTEPPAPAVPDFTLTVANSGITVPQFGAAQSESVQVNPSDGFSGTVDITIQGLPAGVNLNSASSVQVSVSQGNSNGAVFVFLGTSGAVAGSYPIILTGTSGSLTNSVSFTLTVTSTPDFSLRIGSPTLIVTQNCGGPSQSVEVVPVNGFMANVDLTVQGVPDGITVSPNGTIQVSPSEGLPVMTNIRFTGSPAVAFGSYTITITASSGGLTHSITFTLTVPPPDFSLSVESPVVTVQQQGAINGQLFPVNPQNCFTAPVDITMQGFPAGVTLSPAGVVQISTPLGISVSAFVAFDASASVAVGSYPITLTGTGGNSHPDRILHANRDFLRAPFRLSLSTSQINISPGQQADFTATVTTSGNLPSGTVFLSPSDLPANSGLELFQAGTQTVTPTSVSQEFSLTADPDAQPLQNFTVDVTLRRNEYKSVLLPTFGCEYFSPGYDASAKHVRARRAGHHRSCLRSCTKVSVCHRRSIE